MAGTGATPETNPMKSNEDTNSYRLITKRCAEEAFLMVETSEGVQDFIAELSVFAGIILGSAKDEVFLEAIISMQREAGIGKDLESLAIRATCHWAELVRKENIERILEENITPEQP
jgi:hypothetical protein